MHKDFRCLKLSQEYMKTNWEKIYKIDEEHVTSGALEYWDKANYLFDLEHKWELSSYVCKGKELLGYRIVSGRGKYPHYAHSHRTSIKAAYLRKGIATILLSKSISSAKRYGYIGFTGLVNKHNIRSKKFLESTSWKNSGKILSNNELWYLNFN